MPSTRELIARINIAVCISLTSHSAVEQYFMPFGVKVFHEGHCTIAGYVAVNEIPGQIALLNVVDYFVGGNTLLAFPALAHLRYRQRSFCS